MQPDKKIETTIGDRLSTGAVNAGVNGGFVAVGGTAVQAVRNLLSKTKDIKLFPKRFLQAYGVIALASGIYSFFTADRAKEVQMEQGIDQIIARHGGLDRSQTNAQADQMVSQLGDLLANPDKFAAQNPAAPNPAPQTHFQDKVLAGVQFPSKGPGL